MKSFVLLEAAFVVQGRTSSLDLMDVQDAVQQLY